MAVYEYLCDKCGARFEKRMPMSEFRDVVPCTKCKAKARKAISNFAFVGRSQSGDSLDFGDDEGLGAMGGMGGMRGMGGMPGLDMD